jgi:hypothetical protein
MRSETVTGNGNRMRRRAVQAVGGARRRLEITRKAVAMTWREQGARRIGRGWRAAAIGVAVTAVTAAMIGTVGSALAAPPATTAAPPATTTAARPAAQSAAEAGWAPVSYRNAQLSVPGSSWLVEARQQLMCGLGDFDGMIFAGVTPGFPKGWNCGVTASLAWILPAGKIPKGLAHCKPSAVIHGIPVYRLASAKGTAAYLVPELGVRIGARGKLAARVLATLTRSPLDVVLSRGPVARVPAGWTWRQFGGVAFATPRSWGLQREDQWSTCGTGLWPSALLLVDATKPPLYLPCPLQLPFASVDEAEPGLVAVTGKYAAESVGESYGSCQSRRGVRICLSKATGQGGLPAGVLIFSVTRPHQAATYFLLGLAGSGATARAVFDSIGLHRA